MAGPPLALPERHPRQLHHLRHPRVGRGQHRDEQNRVRQRRLQQEQQRTLASRRRKSGGRGQ